MDDPWWITAARVLVVVGLGAGAVQGFLKWRADKRNRSEGAPGASSEDNETRAD